jgi:hypothetical protein
MLVCPHCRLHWYFNDECERSVMLAVLNPPEGVASQFAVCALPAELVALVCGSWHKVVEQHLILSCHRLDSRV